MRQQLHSCLQTVQQHSNSQRSQALQPHHYSIQKRACLHRSAEHACVQIVVPESDEHVAAHLDSGHLQQAGEIKSMHQQSLS